MTGGRRYLPVELVVIVMLTWCALVAGQSPALWRLVTRDADGATAVIDRSRARTGSGSGRLIVEPRSERDVAILQALRGDIWRGKRVQVSGFVSGAMSEGDAGLVVVVNNGSRYGLYFPSRERLSKGWNDWRFLSTIVDVPRDATLLSIGVWIRRGRGSVWLDDVGFEEVPRTSGASTEPRRSSPMTRNDLERIGSTYERATDHPSNLDFEGPGNTIDTW